jgi:hypothetical protein
VSAPVAAASAPTPIKPVSAGPIRRVINAVLRRPKPETPREAAPAASPLTLDAAWRDGWRAMMPDAPVPPIPKEDRAVLKTLKDRLDKNRSLDSLDFIAWAVGNWKQIMAERFTWMTRFPPPPLPALRFLARDTCLRIFLEAYAEHQEREAIKRLPDRDEAEIRHRMGKGLTREKAVLELATERAAAKNRAERATEREAVRQAYDALQADRRALHAPPVAKPKTKPLHERVDPNAWEGIEVNEDDILDLSKMNLKAME